MKAEKMTVPAEMKQVVPVAAMVNRIMAQLNCIQRSKMQIAVVIDEIFSNIVQYAYENQEGTVTVEAEAEEDPPCLVIRFIDQGMPFDPLAVRDPEMTGPAKKRSVGGLGLYIVKKTMDKVSYEYKNGSNILVIRKYI